MKVTTQLKALQNLKRSRKKSWKVMEFEELKRVRTLSVFRVNRAKICNWSRVNEVFGQIFQLVENSSSTL